MKKKSIKKDESETSEKNKDSKKLKEKKEEKSILSLEESELEKDIKQTKKIVESSETEKNLSGNLLNKGFVRDAGFQIDLSAISKRSSPVLEDVASSGQTIDTGVVPVNVNREREEDDKQNLYNVAGKEKEDRKYSEAASANYEVGGGGVKYQTEVRPHVLSSSGISEEAARQEHFIDPMAGTGINPQNNMQPGIIDAGHVSKKRKLTFQREERKYDKVNV